MKRQRIHREIAAYAAAHAGTGIDLDADLEQAGFETLEAGESKLTQPIGTLPEQFLRAVEAGIRAAIDLED